MLYHFILVIFTLTTFARGADDKNHFTNPTSWTDINPVWKLGEEQVIARKTTLGEFNISIRQQSLIQESAASQGNIYSKIHASDKVTNFTWVVQLYGFDLDRSNVIFLWINYDTPEGFTSAYFNITELDSAETGEYTPPSPSPTSNSTASLTNTPPPQILRKSHKMYLDTKYLQSQPQIHPPTALPAYEYNMDTLEQQQRPRTLLRRWAQVKEEWRYGSKSWVFKYY
ncbi:uncharacterized protein BJX67DRAFT_378054 [Aspergillus lucknowensis]|uniref:Uncharacterized protein n=1 Tax=Aspergillus lucknowensis TaxID=176173 RepID=A0ABR4M1N6_9EURO